MIDGQKPVFTTTARRHNAANYSFLSIGPRAAFIAPAPARLHVCGTANRGFHGWCELAAADPTASRLCVAAVKLFVQCNQDNFSADK